MNFNEALHYYLKIKLDFMNVRFYERPSHYLVKYNFFITFFLIMVSVHLAKLISLFLTQQMEWTQGTLLLVHIFLYVVIYSFSRYYIQKPFLEEVIIVLQEKIPNIKDLDVRKLDKFLKEYEDSGSPYKLDLAIQEKFINKKEG